MIGIYGGTFDPVHYGHLRTALEIKEKFSLDEIRLIPCHCPPHREQPVASPEFRLQMLRRAVKNQPDIIIDNREFERAGPSYMVDTLKSLKLEFGSQSLLLIIGSDAFQQITHWYQWKTLFDYAHIVVMTRPGTTAPELTHYFKSRLAVTEQQLTGTECGHIIFLDVTQLDISANNIRRIIAENRNPSFLLPDEVIQYIQNHQLYVQAD